MASKLETEQLRVFFLPFLAAGHMIPMVDLARLFAMHGVAVTIVTTTANALIFQNSVDRDINSGHQIRIHALQFPSSEVGLSAGVENLNAASSFEHSVGINKALAMLRVPVETLFREERPDCIVSDLLYPWTTDVAAELGIPRIFFNGSSFFWFCAERSLHETKTDCYEDDAVLLSGLPHKIELLRSQIPDWMKTTDSRYALFNALRESESKIYGAVMNSFDELEPAYVAHFRNTMKMEAWSVGPVSLWLNRDNLPDVGKTTVNNADQAHDDHKEILNWLNSKEHNSVIYVSFGSLARFRSTQLKEISHGLEASGHPFIWVCEIGHHKRSF
ncbi:hypothetical protein TIFTF001_053651 [Ficus carica]|uniref:Glycosyltransferase N-terminal domain-containing protein n=1 Tax=Ficus carica TaxID=3494 RepID=A0AA88EH72_FICCA|nr:hypothetical protein TIFTF001_053651 [Ficus carica]